MMPPHANSPLTLFLLINTIISAKAFLPIKSLRPKSFCLSKAGDDPVGSDDPVDSEQPSVLLKAAWLGTELLGNIAGVASKDNVIFDVEPPPSSLTEAAMRLRADYERDYFVTGEVDAELYDEDCVFADPFAAFNGRQRFVDNLQNLGTFIVGYNIKMLSFEEQLSASPPTITTRVMVKLQLNLPWKPVLAWPWGVLHTYDSSSSLIVEHRESWEVSAGEGLAQCFRPGSAAVLKKLESKK